MYNIFNYLSFSSVVFGVLWFMVNGKELGVIVFSEIGGCILVMEG